MVPGAANPDSVKVNVSAKKVEVERNLIRDPKPSDKHDREVKETDRYKVIELCKDSLSSAGAASSRNGKAEAIR